MGVSTGTAVSDGVGMGPGKVAGGVGVWVMNGVTVPAVGVGVEEGVGAVAVRQAIAASVAVGPRPGLSLVLSEAP